jgi:hypothetical protein
MFHRQPLEPYGVMSRNLMQSDTLFSGLYSLTRLWTLSLYTTPMLPLGRMAKTFKLAFAL